MSIVYFIVAMAGGDGSLWSGEGLVGFCSPLNDLSILVKCISAQAQGGLNSFLLDGSTDLAELIRCKLAGCLPRSSVLILE